MHKVRQLTKMAMKCITEINVEVTKFVKQVMSKFSKHAYYKASMSSRMNLVGDRTFRLWLFTVRDKKKGPDYIIHNRSGRKTVSYINHNSPTMPVSVTSETLVSNPG